MAALVKTVMMPEITCDVEAFLADAVEHPDDPAPRLIFADWLDEHGDRRAQAMRELIPAPAEINPRSFDARRVDNIRWGKVTGRSNRVDILRGGEPAKLFGAELRTRLAGEDGANHLIGTLFNWRDRRHLGQVLIPSSGRLNAFPISGIGVFGPGRFVVDFWLRMFMTEVEAADFRMAPMEEDEWAVAIAWRPHNPHAGSYRHDFCCTGKLRDPATALKVSLSELMPERKGFIEQL